MEVVKPLFIVGTGRCGSSIFQRILTYHPETTWLSPVSSRWPDRPERNRLAMSLVDRGPLGPLLRKRIFPIEDYGFWDRICPGFTEPFHDLGADDIPPKSAERLRNTFGRMLSPRRHRMLDKVTGWPRIGFLKSVFPDARFIHIRRDGRAVANSMLNVEWWSGWGGPHRWRWGELTAEQRAKWDRFDQSFVALAAIEWEILMEATEKAAGLLAPEDYLDISYTELCADPVGTCRRAVEFMEVDWTAAFEARVGRFELRNTDYKWRTDLNSNQRDVLNACLAESLERFGFPLDESTALEDS